MPPKKSDAKRPHPDCKCGAPATGYLDPTSSIESEASVRQLHFDPKTRKSYFTCQHGNEFEYSEVRE